MNPLLVLRPEPGTTATIGRATAAGFEAIAAPIFMIAAQAWEAPDASAHDALMLTSANAVRHAGPALDRYRLLPVYAVGAASAAAAIEAGFTDIRTGDGDAEVLIASMVRDGVTRPLHLAGREHREFDNTSIPIERRIVYAADPVAILPAAAQAAVARGAVALIHSPRAGETFDRLLRKADIDPITVAIAAISQAAAAGHWRETAIAETPDDSALLAAAARLCEKG
jgi:uroporphyrinogen-III synthase